MTLSLQMIGGMGMLALLAMMFLRVRSCPHALTYTVDINPPYTPYNHNMPVFIG